MQIGVRIKGSPQFNRNMADIQRRLRDTRPLMRSLAITSHKWIMENYRTGGGLLKGRRWPKLAASTVASRRRKSSKPLQDTGHLQRQWNWRATRSKAVIGNPMDIARYHEEGTGIYGPGGQPYEIRPKTRRALWFGTATSGVTIATRRRGQKLGGRLAHVTGRPPRAFGQQPGVFATRVLHPGVRKRRQLPTEAEVLPRLLKTTEVWMDKLERTGR